MATIVELQPRMAGPGAIEFIGHIKLVVPRRKQQHRQGGHFLVAHGHHSIDPFLNRRFRQLQKTRNDGPRGVIGRKGFHKLHEGAAAIVVARAVTNQQQRKLVRGRRGDRFNGLSGLNRHIQHGFQFAPRCIAEGLREWVI